MLLRTSSAYDIRIESVLVESERLQKQYEIAANVTEISIFEHVDLPFLTATLMVSDSSNILGMIGFRGTERVTITVKVGGDTRAQAVTRTFVVTDVAGIAPVNDQVEALSLNLVDEFAYRSRLVTVRKAYSGKPEEIIETVAREHLSLDVSKPPNFSGSVVPPIRVVVPALSPLDTLRWVKNRLVSANGTPFFLYSTLSSPGLVLRDLETILTTPPKNAARPYGFGQAFTRFTTGKSVDDQARVIESYRLARSENMAKMMTASVLNSSYDLVNTTEDLGPEASSLSVRMSEVLSSLRDKKVIPRDQDGPTYDTQFRIGDKTIDEYSPADVARIVSSNTFSNFQNYYETGDLAQAKLHAYSRALRYYLLKSPLEVGMPGFDFLGRGDCSVGTQVRLVFLKNDPDLAFRGGDVLDKKKSGDYVVYAARHLMKPERYSVSLTCVKLGEAK